jgi:hypothetical protein
MVAASVNRVDPDPARIEAGLETAETSGVLSLRKSPLLAGPMRQTDKSVRDEGWPLDRYGQGAKAHSFRGGLTCA